jgi:hypothetical protein
MAAHRKSDWRRDDLCGGGFRSSGVLPTSGSGSADFVQDAVNCFFNRVNFSVEAFNGASHLSQTSMWAEALQVRLVNRAVVPLVAFDLSRDRSQRFHRQYWVIARKVWRSTLVGFCCAKIAVIACGKSSLTISRNAVGAWAGSHCWMVKGKQSGSWTRIATTETVSLRVRMKSWRRLSSLTRKSGGHIAFAEIELKSEI